MGKMVIKRTFLIPLLLSQPSCCLYHPAQKQQPGPWEGGRWPVWAPVQCHETSDHGAHPGSSCLCTRWGLQPRDAVPAGDGFASSPVCRSRGCAVPTGAVRTPGVGASVDMSRGGCVWISRGGSKDSDVTVLPLSLVPVLLRGGVP